jgi:hypothetical protein
MVVDLPCGDVWHRRTDSNDLRRVWNPTALPGALRRVEIGGPGEIRTLTPKDWFLRPARLPVTPPAHGAPGANRTRNHVLCRDTLGHSGSGANQNLLKKE